MSTGSQVASEPAARDAAHRSRRPGGRVVGVWLLTCLAAFVALAGWSMASPPGSSPDDDYHLASIWCAQGIDGDRCAAVEGEPDQRLLPYLASGAASCFATDFTVSGSCQDDFTTDEPAIADRPRQLGWRLPALLLRVAVLLHRPRTSRRPC